MSMISSQVGELRFMAYMLDTDGHPSFAREVRRAADTIWELRNKLASTVDQRERITELDEENAKLRKLVQKTWKWEKNGCYECPLEEDCKVLCVYDGDCGIAVEIEKELQELRIEVDA